MRTGACKICKLCKDEICSKDGHKVHYLDHKVCFEPDFGYLEEKWRKEKIAKKNIP